MAVCLKKILINILLKFVGVIEAEKVEGKVRFLGKSLTIVRIGMPMNPATHFPLTIILFSSLKEL